MTHKLVADTGASADEVDVEPENLIPRRSRRLHQATATGTPDKGAHTFITAKKERLHKILNTTSSASPSATTRTPQMQWRSKRSAARPVDTAPQT
ncbi:hypothetical protein U9M48_042319 [Paspalum notatum var. saurae]|uniref:Uncharacterized protein n=1 Tax=Paspalum notatum var. saurae TaxID=547442 RepID=A0AAQ3XF33_PASNO